MMDSRLYSGAFRFGLNKGLLPFGGAFLRVGNVDVFEWA